MRSLSCSIPSLGAFNQLEKIFQKWSGKTIQLKRCLHYGVNCSKLGLFYSQKIFFRDSKCISLEPQSPQGKPTFSLNQDQALGIQHNDRVVVNTQAYYDPTITLVLKGYRGAHSILQYPLTPHPHPPQGAISSFKYKKRLFPV